MALTGCVYGGGLAASAGAAFALSRLVGAAGFGVLSLGLAWGVSLGALASAGTDKLLLREASVRTYPDRLPAVRRFAAMRSTRASVIAGLVAFGVAAVGLDQPSMAPALVAVVVGTGVMLRQQAVLVARKSAAVGYFGQLVALPGAWVGVAALLSATMPRPSPATGVAAYALATSGVIAIQALLLRRSIDTNRPRAPRPPVDSDWVAAARQFFAITGVVVAQAYIATLILGALGSHTQVAVYVVSVRLATVVSLPLAVVTAILAPRVASRATHVGAASLQQTITRGARLAVPASAAIAAIVWFARGSLVDLLGPGFEGLPAPLGILVVAEVLNVCIGPVATLLSMSGHERDVRAGLVSATLVGAAVCVTLVPAFGATGAAISAAISLMTWNVWLNRRVHTRLGLSTGPGGKRNPV